MNAYLERGESIDGFILFPPLSFICYLQSLVLSCLDDDRLLQFDINRQ